MRYRLIASCLSETTYEWIQKTMSSDLMLDFENHRQHPAMDSEIGIISIDQGGEWGKRRFTTLLLSLTQWSQGSYS